jgi:hypothetical protein
LELAIEVAKREDLKQTHRSQSIEEADYARASASRAESDSISAICSVNEKMFQAKQKLRTTSDATSEEICSV